MSVKHIGPNNQLNNGVALYSALTDKIIEGLPVADEIEHYELGYTGSAEFWQAWAAFKRGAKTVLTLHDPPAVAGKPFAKYLPRQGLLSKACRKLLDVLVGRLLIRRMLRGASALIVLNKESKPMLARKFGLPADKIWVLPLPPLLPASTESPNNAGADIILTFGNLSPRKGAHLLIRAFHEVYSPEAPAQLVIAGGHQGEEKYYEELVALTKRLGETKRVIFKGALPDAQLAAELSQATVVVLPYLDPGIIHASGPLISAMAAGKPVVASRVPIFEGEIEDSKTGLLFDEGSIEDLKNKLSQLISQPSLASKIGKAAANHIQSQHNQAIIKDKLMEIYRSV